MTTPECPKATMVEALRDGRLGPQELASMERHVAVCAACTRLSSDLDRIGDSVREPVDPATPLEHQRARFALLRRATTPVGTPAPADRAASLVRPLTALLTPGRLRFAFAASFAVFAFVVGWVARSSAPADALGRGQRAAKAGLGRDVILRSSSEAHFERSHEVGLDVVKLEDGALDLTLPQRTSGDRFVVRTHDAEIDVRATAFHVVAQQGRIRSVAVEEGSVEVRYAGFTAVITSGGSWRATDDASAQLAPKEPKEPTPAASAASADHPATSTTVAAAAVEKVAARARSVVARREHPRATTAAASASVVEAPGPVSVATPSTAPGAEASTASRHFAAAMHSLGRGDYDRAADMLGAFAAAHPGDARSDEADYLRAIALQRRGQLTEAAAVAKRYLATRPSGAHRAEAKMIAGE